jgi:hypothetical protein
MDKKQTVEKLQFNKLSESQLKKIKQLLRATTGERAVTAQKTDPIYLVYDNKFRLIGFAMISSYSPENHFKQEGPYLYNFVTNTCLPKDRRCGKFLFNYVCEDLKAAGHSIMNLDVEHTNLRAFKFFIVNKCRVVGKYEKVDFKNLKLHEVDQSIQNHGLQDQIDEIKSRRGIKDSSSLMVHSDDASALKKITYVSMSCAL